MRDPFFVLFVAALVLTVALSELVAAVLPTLIVILLVPPSLEDLAASAEILPSDRQLERLARAVVAREHRRGQPADQVRIDVWRVEFAPGSLAPRDHLLRRYEFRAAP